MAHIIIKRRQTKVKREKSVSILLFFKYIDAQDQKSRNDVVDKSSQIFHFEKKFFKKKFEIQKKNRSV